MKENLYLHQPTKLMYKPDFKSYSVLTYLDTPVT